MSYRAHQIIFIASLLAIPILSNANTQFDTSLNEHLNEQSVFHDSGSNTLGLSQSFAIRGLEDKLGQTDLFRSNLLVDDVAIPSTGLLTEQWLDVESAKILNGPQLLTPIHSNSGSIVIKHNKPDLEQPSAVLQTKVENHTRRSLSGIWNQPLADEISALRIVALYQETSGSVSASRDTGLNITNTRTQGQNTVNRKFVRGQYLIEPQQDFSILINASYTKADDNCCADALLERTTLAQGGFFSENNLPNNLNQPFTGSRAINDRLAHSDDAFSLLEKSNYSASFNFKINQTDFTIDTYYGEYDNKSRRSLEQSPLDVIRIASFTGNNSDDFGQFDDGRLISHHFKIQNHTNEHLGWTVGASFQLNRTQQTISTVLGSDHQSFFTAQSLDSIDALASLAVAEGVAADSNDFINNISGFTELSRRDLLFAIAGDSSSANAFARNQFLQRHSRASIYWHTLWRPFDALTIDGTIRSLIEEKKADFTQLDASNVACDASLLNADLNTVFNQGQSNASITLRNSYAELYDSLLAGACPAFASAANAIAPDGSQVAQTFNTTYKKGGWMGQLQATYTIEDNVNAWIKLSNTLNPGGINLNPIAATSNNLTYDSERYFSYEIGFNGGFAENKVQFELSLYHQDIRDLQALVPYLGVSDFARSDLLFNIDKAMNSGIDTNISLNWSDQLNASLSFSYNDARTASNCNTSRGELNGNERANLCGKRFSSIPESKASLGLTYRFAEFESRDLLFNTKLRYESERNLLEEIGEISQRKIDDALQTDFTLTLAPKSLDKNKGRQLWTISFFVKNIGDQPVRNPRVLPGQPGSLAASFTDPKRYGMAFSLPL